jgi:hypothetical protein
VKKIRLYVFPYRDQYFLSSYGAIVRDLMMVSSLSEEDCIDKITVYNRPVSIHERFLMKKRASNLVKMSDKIEFSNANSYDLMGPLSSARWKKNVYSISYSTQPTFDKNYTNIVLDFLPFSTLPNWALNADLYWYDLIDNFTKHNRYTALEKTLVEEKYKNIMNLGTNNLVTGVCQNALVGFENSHVIENAILNLPVVKNEPSKAKFDFGFMGFITNKFNVNTVKKISSLGFTIAIYGEFYDKSVEQELKNISNVRLFGRFNASDSNNLLATFKVGLIPYINELLHDESPLKLYQYLCASKLVLSSFDFDFSHEMFYVYDSSNLKDKIQTIIDDLQKNKTIPADELIQFTWKSRINKIIEIIKEKTLSKVID